MRASVDRFISWLARLITRGLYRSVELRGFDDLPGGPRLIVANHFNGFVDPVVLAGALGRLPRLRLVINIPPRHSKSAIISKLFQAWRWLSRPEEQSIALAAAATLIERDGMALRRVVTSPEYVALAAKVRASRGLPGWTLRSDMNAKKKFDTTEGGTRHG